jgi:molybdenum cofactor cytidylyltransferase
MGIKPELMPGVREFVRSRGKFLLIEADGSRQRPLKAPADHEPVIPDFVDMVVVLVGLSGLGKPVREDWVHRPERFAELAGGTLGDPVTAEDLARVLNNPRGGLKSIPPGARRVALLNQADSVEIQTRAQHLASLLAPAYHAVVISSLEQSQIHAVHEPTAGVILAAGGASRMGKPKQLLSWRGMPLVRHAASAAMNAGLTPVCVVVGAYEDQVRAALDDLPLRIARNTAWETGQSSSMKAGLAALPEQTGSVIFLLADQPKVTVALLRTLVERHARTLAPVLAPRIDGRRSNPVLFDRLTFADLMRVQGDVGGRAIFSAYPVTWLDWDDPGAGMDIDTEADFQKLVDSEPGVDVKGDG